MNILSKTLSWTGEAWKAVLPVYEKILRLPFITELAAGTLDKDIFMYYIRQDSLYLKDYARVMDIMAARISEPELSAMFGRFAKENIEVRPDTSVVDFIGEEELKAIEYTDKDGNKRTVYEVVADNANFCGSKAESGSGSAPIRNEPPASYSNADVGDFEEISMGDDDLPF